MSTNGLGFTDVAAALFEGVARIISDPAVGAASPSLQLGDSGCGGGGFSFGAASADGGAVSAAADGGAAPAADGGGGGAAPAPSVE